MTIRSVSDLTDVLQACQILTPAQIEELVMNLQNGFAEPAFLAEDLVLRGWLTVYQAKHIFLGKASELSLGQYVLLELIGEGGMGRVYRARHRHLDRIDAVKVIHPSQLAQPQALRRFQQEARAAARLSHPNIVTVYNAAEHGGRHYLAMEYVEGEDLACLVRNHGRLPVEQAVEYVYQASLGLQHAFERDLVHRDIKPSNLLVTADRNILKILDMGLALLGQVRYTPSSSPAAASQVMGTADYMSPEQAANSHAVDIRSDLYSLGCTAYFLLAGEVPFPEGTVAEKLILHQQAEPVCMSQKRKGLPPGLVEIIRRLMAKHPEDRYQTPAELAAALEPFRVAQGRGGNTSSLWGSSGSRVVKASRTPLPPAISSAKLSFPIERHEEVGSRSVPRRVDPRHLLTPSPEDTVIGLDYKKRRVGNIMRRPYLLAGAGLVATIVLLGVLLSFPGLRSAGEAHAIQEVQRLSGHLGPVSRLAVSPDGRRVVSVGTDQEIHLWDLEAGVTQRRWAAGQGTVLCLAWTADGRRVLSGGSDGSVCLWNPDSGQREACLLGHRHPVNDLAVSPRGDYVLVGGGKADPPEAELNLWHLPSLKEVYHLKGHSAAVTCVAFSRDGRLGLSASADRMLHLWDLTKGKSERMLDAGTGRILAIDFSPQGHEVICSQDDGALRLWNCLTGKQRWVARMEAAVVRRVRFTCDGCRIIAGGSDGVLRLLDTATGEVLGQTPAHRGPIHDLALVSETGQLICCGADQLLRLWRLPD